MASNTRNTTRLASLPRALGERLRTTAALSVGLLGRRDSLAVFLAVTTGYLVAFLYMMTDMVLNTSAGFGVTVPVDDPLSLMFQRGPGQFSYEAIALVELGVATWAFSPINTAIGLVLAVLVGVNLALTYLAVTQPKACGIGAGSGVLASVPALLAGSACCAPVVAVVLGLQLSGVVLSAFAWLLPVSLVLLLGSLIYVAGSVDVTAV